MIEVCEVLFVVDTSRCEKLFLCHIHLTQKLVLKKLCKTDENQLFLLHPFHAELNYLHFNESIYYHSGYVHCTVAGIL